MTYEKANDFIKKLNEKSYAGYTDWRLPSVKELISLIDYSQYNPALPQGHPFTNVQSSYYWSSTSHAHYTNHAWIVYMYYGYVHYSNKTNYLYVWPVRAGRGSLDDLGIRFIDHDDGTVTDTGTGLMWTKNANLAEDS